jgi:hypothetical protein
MFKEVLWEELGEVYGVPRWTDGVAGKFCACRTCNLSSYLMVVIGIFILDLQFSIK